MDDVLGMPLTGWPDREAERMDEPHYPCSGFLSDCVFRDWRDDFRTDCFYYIEDEDMGATIPWCSSNKTICKPHQCDGCRDFISKAEVHDVVSHILEEKRGDNGRTD